MPKSSILIRLLVTAVIALTGAGSVQAGSPSHDALQLASVAAAVGTVADQEAMVAKNAEYPLAIASITKLMTAMVVLDTGRPLDEWVTIVERDEAAPNNAYSRIRIGSRLKRGDLIRIALMASENLAAYVLSRDYPGGRGAFIKAMNDKARALGMENTRFVGASGLSPGNRSTAADLLKMVRASYGYAKIREYTTTTFFVARFRGPRYTLRYGNTNPLVSSSRWPVSLSKTGYLSEAGRCLVMVTRVDDRDVAMVLLDSFGKRTPLGDAGRIRRWMTTGAGGAVAGPALDYERRRTRELGKLTVNN